MTKAKSKSYEIDMCNGPILSKMLLFALPLMCSSVLQLLFNAADVIVVGRFRGAVPLAAVGAPGTAIFTACYLYFLPLWNLFMNLLRRRKNKIMA